MPTRGAYILPCLAALCAAPTIARGGTLRADRDPQSSLDLAADPRYAAAGAVRVDRSGDPSRGSGVLIGDRWVLTAAHLLAGTTSLTFTIGGEAFVADGWVSHPRYTGDLRAGFDLGLVRLAEPVTDISPAGLYHWRNEQNRVAVFDGFGRTGTGLTGGQPLNQTDGRRRAGTNVIDGSVDPKLGYGHYTPKLAKSANLFVTDFDNPADASDNTSDNATGSPEPTDLELLICQGDSGGPVFLPDPRRGHADAPPLVAGIHSFGEFIDAKDDSDYGDITGHTRVSVFRPWIQQTMKRATLGKNVPDFVTPTPEWARELDSLTTVVPEPSLGGMAVSVLFLARRRSRANSNAAGALHRSGRSGADCRMSVIRLSGAIMARRCGAPAALGKTRVE
jgi:hypothetical protein